MIHLITGGSGSGKSAYAENTVLSNCASVQDGWRKYIYIATMKPYGEETLKKIERHHRLRAGKGFETVECYTDLSTLSVPENSGVLLECISNLAANEFYREDGTLHDEQETLKRITEGVRHISKQTQNFVIVTNEVSSDINGYSEETKQYIALLGAVNQRLARMADKVTEVVYGIPVTVKA